MAFLCIDLPVNEITGVGEGETKKKPQIPQPTNQWMTFNQDVKGHSLEPNLFMTCTPQSQVLCYFPASSLTTL